MKILSSAVPLIFSASILMGCATNPDNLEKRLKKQDERFESLEKRQTARANSFSQRMQRMSDNADARYDRSYDKLMGREE